MFDKLKALSEGAAVKAKALSSRTAGAIETSKAHLGDAAATARTKGRELAGATAEKGSALIDRHWHTIERVTVDGLLNVSAEKLKDDATVKDVLERAYEALPTVVRLVLPRDRYLEVVIQKKQPLLDKIEGARNRRQERAQSATDVKDRQG